MGSNIRVALGCIVLSPTSFLSLASRNPDSEAPNVRSPRVVRAVGAQGPCSRSLQ